MNNGGVLYNFDGNVFYDCEVLKIYDQCMNEIGSFKDRGLEQLYDFFGIHKEKGVFKRNVVLDKISADIASYAAMTDIVSLKRELKQCRRRIFFRDYQNVLYYAVNVAIINAVSGVKAYKCHELSREIFTELIRNACYYVILNSVKFCDMEGERIFTCRDDDNYVKAIRRAGDILGKDTDIDGDISGYVKDICRRIYSSIFHFGGEKFYECLISEFAHCYNSKENRINVNSANNIAFPFLYNAVLRVMTSNPGTFTEDEAFDDFASVVSAAEVTVILADGSCSEALSCFQNLISPCLKDLIIHSALYDLHQYYADGVLFFVERIIDGYSSEISKAFSLPTYKVMKFIEDITLKVHKCFVSGKVPVIVNAEGEMKDFLCKMSSSSPLNEGYESPEQWDKVTSDSEWIIPFGSKFYIIPDVMGAWGIYEKLSDILRGELKKFPDYGHILENAVKDLFKEQGITLYCGYYYMFDGKMYECDALAVDDEHAIIIECKQKPLTRQSRGGNEEKIICDIKKSFVASQEQAARLQRAILCSGGNFEMYPPECKGDEAGIRKGRYASIKITLNCPNVMNFLRISCTCGGYWVLGEPFMTRLMNNASRSEYSSLEQICNTEHDKRKLRFESLFISFDRLYHIISIVKPHSVKEVFDTLKQFTNIQSNGMDTFDHISFFSSLRNRE